MARFTKTWEDGLFMGWDSLKPTAECVEATNANDLGAQMGTYTYYVFLGMKAGEKKKDGPPGTFSIEYYRDH